MNWKPRSWILIGMFITILSAAGHAQLATTQVADTVYHADGTTASGTVLISWPAFTTSAGDAVATGNTSVTLGTGGTLSVSLTPNSGAIPIGTYYTAVFHLDDGSVTRQYWVIPVSSTSVKLSAIETTVLPTTVAMQTVSKSYVDTAIASAVAGHPIGTTPYVLKAGDTMAGPLNLAADPVTTYQAADKHYVDANIAAIASGIGQKVSTTPTGTQAIMQPTGTLMQVNNLNSVEYASQYVTGSGGNGIANAVSGSDCASGCDVHAEHNYGSSETYWTGSLNSGTHVTDLRGGSQVDSFLNPLGNASAGLSTGQKLDMISTVDAATLSQETNSSTPASVGLTISHVALAGGSNLLPGSIETPPFFKMAYSAATISGSYNTQGQHGLMPQQISCYGVGDCLLGARFVTASGGSRDEADEGAHLYDTSVLEDSRVFQGTCISGCTTGSTSVTLRQDYAAGTQGDGRFLIDKNTAKTYSTATTGGLIISGDVRTPHATAQFSGTNFPVSIFLNLGTTVTSQGNSMAPGTVTVPIATTGVISGYATSTGAIGNSSGVACVVEGSNGGYYEMAPYTVVDGTHLQMTFKKPHNAMATLAFGGLCGYGIEQIADTANGIRQVFPIVGSYSSTGIYYESLASAVLGQLNQTGAFLNLNTAISSLTRSGGVVTVQTSVALPYDVNGLQVTIAGASDSSFNGTFSVTTTSQTSFTYTQSGADGSASGGTISYENGSFVIYPIAEVLSVFNTASRSIDGLTTLAPNNVAWAANDPVEEPHWFQEDIWAGYDLYEQSVPRPNVYTRGGIQYGGNNSGSMYGWSIQNITPQTNYFGYGGTHTIPVAAFESLGPWQHNMNLTAGEQSVFTIYCNLHGCGNWNSGYDLFQLQDNLGFSYVHYNPQAGNLSLNIRGTNYSFSQSGFTGSINASSVNSGTLPSSVLPAFGGSGTSHSAGAVPDPGATQGYSRFLREDGTWALPPSGSGSGGSGISAISGMIVAGSGINLSGAGTSSSPYAISVGGAIAPITAFGGATPIAAAMTGSSTAFVAPIIGYASDMTPGGESVVEVGRDLSNYDTAYFGLKFAGNNSPSNMACVGLFDADNLLCVIPGGEARLTAGGMLGWNGDTGLSRTSAGSVALGNGTAGDASGLLSLGAINAALYKGPATAPSGACSQAGWAFSQDGHITFCNGSTWISKM